LFEYSADNKYLATISSHVFYIWDIFDEKIIKKIANENLYSLSFSPDCKHVAISVYNLEKLVFNFLNQELLDSTLFMNIIDFVP
jgi:WD40 repeat protein